MNIQKILLTTVVALGLVACGGGSSDSTESNPTPTPVPSEVPSTKACDVDGNTVIAPASGEECTYKQHTLACTDDGKVNLDRGAMTAQTVTINGLSFICDK